MTPLKLAFGATLETLWRLRLTTYPRPYHYVGGLLDSGKIYNMI